MNMSGLRFALVFVLLLLTTVAFTYTPGAGRAAVVSAAPALQATASTSAAPTPALQTTPPTAAPIGEGTQQVLTILGLVIGVVVLIGGGIYLRHRWMATRY
jgi:hypothetical protein